MTGLILRLSVVIGLGCLIVALQGCGAVEIYGGLRRSDTRTITETTVAPSKGMAESVYDWLFVDSTKQGKA